MTAGIRSANICHKATDRANTQTHGYQCPSSGGQVSDMQALILAWLLVSPLKLYVIFSSSTDTVPLSRSSSNPNHVAVVDGFHLHFAGCSTKPLFSSISLTLYWPQLRRSVPPWAALLPTSNYLCITIFMHLPRHCATNGLSNLVKI